MNWLFKRRAKLSYYVEVFDGVFDSGLVDKLKDYTAIRAGDWVTCNKSTDYCLAMDINPALHPELDNDVFTIVRSCADRYKSLHPRAMYTRDNGYEILSHDIHSYMKMQWITCPLIVMLCLSDCHGDEGSIILPDQNLTIKSRIGRVICIPGNFIYPFYMKPVKTGERLSIFTTLN